MSQLRQLPSTSRMQILPEGSAYDRAGDRPWRRPHEETERTADKAVVVPRRRRHEAVDAGHPQCHGVSLPPRRERQEPSRTNAPCRRGRRAPATTAPSSPGAPPPGPAAAGGGKAGREWAPPRVSFSSAVRAMSRAGARMSAPWPSTLRFTHAPGLVAALRRHHLVSQPPHERLRHRLLDLRRGLAEGNLCREVLAVHKDLPRRPAGDQRP